MNYKFTQTSNGIEKHCLSKPVFPNKCCTENKLRNGNKFEDASFKSLNVPDKNTRPLQVYERKLPNKLNPINNLSTKNNQTKKLPSKIPVLQKSQLHKNEKTNKSQLDTFMSAADRRQKFQQSRQYIAPQHGVEKTTCFQPVGLYKDFISWYDMNYVNKVNGVFLPALHGQHKTVLPPIKNKVVTETGKSDCAPKKKSLLGEITHFPTLCNYVPKISNKSNMSSVPHLPYILPPPAAPPPSISNSLEKEGQAQSEY